MATAETEVYLKQLTKDCVKFICLKINWHCQVEEIDGDHGAAVEEEEVEAVAVVMEKNAATREAEVEATAENATAAAVDEATVVVTRGVVAPSAIVTVNRYAIRRTVDPAERSVLTRNRFSSEVIGKSYWSSER